MANLKLHTIGIHGGFHHNFLYTVVRTVSSQFSDAWQANDVVCCSSIFVIWREFASKIDYRRYTQCQAVLGAPFSLIVYPRVRVPYDRLQRVQSSVAHIGG